MLSSEIVISSISVLGQASHNAIVSAISVVNSYHSVSRNKLKNIFYLPGEAHHTFR